MFAATSLAQTISITYPATRSVFQRNTDNRTTVYLSGNYYQPIDSVQARLVAEQGFAGISTNWATIQRQPQGGIYQGGVQGTGGWYVLQVRAYYNGAVVTENSVRRIGIGEVFIITGQSNAQGILNGDPEQDGKDFAYVGAKDDRVNAANFDNTNTNSLEGPTSPQFQQLSASVIIGPRGRSAWCWGILGDMIAQQYQVPVLFINTGWGATTSFNWVESADGKPTAYWFNQSVKLPPGMPYGNLIMALRYYSSMLGLRAVLWQQGENDNWPLRTPRDVYRRNMQYLIDRTRADTDRYPAWVLARSSLGEGRLDQNIIAAQTDVINTFNNNVYAGPFTDNIQPDRPTGHFSGPGLVQLAQAWFASMNTDFFARSLPLQPLSQPVVNVACNGGNSLTLTLPGNNFQSYRWESGQTTQSITVSQPGVYRATARDRFGNTYLAPTIEIRNPLQPATPTLSLVGQNSQAGAQQQVCADSTLTVVANVGAQNGALWNVGTTRPRFAIGTAGTYSVQATSVYGCRSAASPAINVTVRPRLPAPTIEQTGLFSIQTLNVPDTIRQFSWRLNNTLLAEQTGPVAKALNSGVYTARSAVTYRVGDNTLTCLSVPSNALTVTISGDNSDIAVYPNPTQNGLVFVELRPDLENARISVYSMLGQTIFTATLPRLNARQQIDLRSVPNGQYLVQVQAEGYNITRRILVNR